VEVPTIAVVHWSDSIVFSGWVHPEPGLHVPRSIVSAGLLVEDTDEHITLATSFDALQGNDGHWGNLTVIPRASVHSVSHITPD